MYDAHFNDIILMYKIFDWRLYKSSIIDRVEETILIEL